MNFVIDLAHRGVSVAQWYNIRARRFDSSWELRIFSLSQARDKTKKNIFLCFFTDLKTYHLSFYLQKKFLHLIRT